MAKGSEKLNGILELFIGLMSSYWGIQAFISSTHTINQIRILLMVGIVSSLFGVWRLYINRSEKTKTEKLILGLLSLVAVVSVLFGIR